MSKTFGKAATDILEVTARQSDEIIGKLTKNSQDFIEKSASVTKNSIETNVKEMALKMLKEDGEKLTKQLAEVQAKSLDDLAVTLKMDTKTLAKNASEIAGSNLNSTEINKLTMEASVQSADILKAMPTDAVKLADNVDPKIATNNSLVESGKIVAESLSKATTPELKKKAIKLLFGLSVLTGIGYGGYLLIDPAVKTSKINSTVFHITAITNKTPKSVIITYEPSQKINKNDIIIISKSLSTPPINGVRQLIKSLSPVEIEIATVGMVPTTIPLSLNEDKLGILKIETTFESQLNADIEKFSATVGGAIGSAAGGVAGGVATGVGEATSGFFNSISSFLTSILNSIYSNPILIGIIICVIICCCVMLILFIYMRK